MVFSHLAKVSQGGKVYVGRTLSRVRQDRRGSIGLKVAFLAVPLLGFVGLGSEVGVLFFLQKKMQNAADAAIIAASAANLDDADRRRHAEALLHANGVVDVTFELNTPPLGGDYAGDTQARELVVTRDYEPVLIGLFRRGPITLRVSATATASGGSEGCLFALAQSGVAVQLESKAHITDATCDILSHSTAANSLLMKNGSLVAGAVRLAGGASLLGSAEIVGSLVTYGTPASDPYADLQLPAAGSCLSGAQAKYKGEATLSPGRYCDGIDIANNSDIKLLPGIYFVDSEFKLGNNSSLSSVPSQGREGVTIVLNGFNGVIEKDSFAVGNNANWTITAPQSGATAGIALMTQPQLKGDFEFSNHAEVSVEGTIYMPGINVFFKNQTRTVPTSCTRLIARTIVVDSEVNFSGQSCCRGNACSPKLVS